MSEELKCPNCGSDCSHIKYDSVIEFEDDGVEYHSANCICGTEIITGVFEEEIVSIECGELS